MSLIQEFPCFSPDPIRKQFLTRVVPDMTEEDKQALQKEYSQAVKQAEKQVEKEIEIIKKKNIATFLAFPKEVIQELTKDFHSIFSLGELLIWSGIATVTMKRHGKGSKACVGSDYEHTVSNFIATAKIGHHVLTMDIGSSNDKYFKDRAKSSMASQLAQQILEQTTA